MPSEILNFLGHSRFNMDWDFFFFFFFLKMPFTLYFWLIRLLGGLAYNIESARTFAILEKQRKEKQKT